MHYERTWCTSVYKNQLVDKMVIRRDILKRINLYWKINFDFTNILTAIAAVLGTLPYHELCKNNMKSLEKNTRSVSYFFYFAAFYKWNKNSQPYFIYIFQNGFWRKKMLPNFCTNNDTVWKSSKKYNFLLHCVVFHLTW